MSHRIYVSHSVQYDNVGVNGYGTEGDQMADFVPGVVELLKKQKAQFDLFVPDKGWTMEQIVADERNLAVDAYVVFHTNAAGDPKVGGAEVYYHAGSVKGQEYANMLYEELIPVSLSPGRGCRADTVLYRSGLYELRETYAPAVLSELFFHTNPDEVGYYMINKARYQIAAAKAICRMVGETFTLPVKLPDNVPQWKYDGMMYLLGVGGIETEHDPLEALDIGTLGKILMNLGIGGK